MRQEVTDENLYNCVHHKTKKVLEYVNSLREPEMVGNYTEHLKKVARFNEVLNEAKNARSANEMLDIVGYRYRQRAKIYD